MTERQQLAADLGDASKRRHDLCRKITRQLVVALAAVDLIRCGNTGAAKCLSNLCRELAYEGDVLCIPMGELIQAEEDRRAALARLEEMDGVEVDA